MMEYVLSLFCEMIEQLSRVDTVTHGFQMSLISYFIEEAVEKYTTQMQDEDI